MKGKMMKIINIFIFFSNFNDGRGKSYYCPFIPLIAYCIKNTHS